MAKWSRIWEAKQPVLLGGTRCSRAWACYVCLVLALVVACSLLWGHLLSFITPERRIDESFGEFVAQVKAADNEGSNALASLVSQYHGATVHWEDCVVVEVIARQKTYRLAPSEDTPAKYQAMAGFGDGVDFKSFIKGQNVDIEGVFDTVNPFAIILYDCRFASKQDKPKKRNGPLGVPPLWAVNDVSSVRHDYFTAFFSSCSTLSLSVCNSCSSVVTRVLSPFASIAIVGWQHSGTHSQDG